MFRRRECLTWSGLYTDKRELPLLPDTYVHGGTGWDSCWINTYTYFFQYLIKINQYVICFVILFLDYYNK